MSPSQHERTVSRSNSDSNANTTDSHSPIEFERRAGPQVTTEPSSSSPQSPQQDSSVSEAGYPSWLPKRPPPPGPRSTIHSASVPGMASGNEAGPSSEPFVGGRKATPRSVRIVSLQNLAYGEKEHSHPRRESTDPSRLFAGAQTRVWSRATSAGMSPTLFSATSVPRPRFRSTSLHLELLRNPSWRMRLWYYLFPLFIFFHLPLQTFFDFNAVFILLLVAKHPNPAAPGVPGTGRNWSLGAAAYIACWVTQVFVVFVMYELIYSFVRRWRVKRPLILPIYFSSPAFNFAAMTSYTNFCFLYHIRASAFSREHGKFRDGLAETFYYYSQNLPTVALLLPRAALSLALLLSFWTPEAGELALADMGVRPRDGTFFRSSDQTLTNYARGVLIANAAWTAWRLLVLFVSWVGLWVLSGQGCAGLCGPRYRWEEEDNEKTIANFSQDNFIQGDSLPWSWREGTLLRVIDAFEFCLTNKHPRGPSGLGDKKDYLGVDTPTGTAPFDGIEKVFAAIGVPSDKHPARRGALSNDLFESPQATELRMEEPPHEIEPPEPAVHPREKEPAAPSASLEKLPYPFTGHRSQVSSQDPIPFPPSPEPGDTEAVTSEGGEDEEEGEEHHSNDVESSEVTTDDRRTSGSMSSLGRPVPSRYPFSFRRPMSGRGSLSSNSHVSPFSHLTHSTQSRSGQSHSTHLSMSTQSTGNRESSDSPASYPSSSNASPTALTGSAIPMPPRHPHRRSRAGTVPMSSPSSQSSISPSGFTGRGQPRSRADSGLTHAESDLSMTFGQVPVPFVLDSEDDEGPMRDDSLMDVPEDEGSAEEAEQHDSVGLLSTGGSPRASRTSLRQFTSGLQRRANGSRSRSGTASRSRTNSSNSESTRSRAQSLIHSIGAASRSSVEIAVRSRANSMARLSDSPYSSSPDPMPSSPENNTFGHPRRRRAEAAGGQDDDHDVSDIAELPERTSSDAGSILGEEVRTSLAVPRQRLASELSRIAPSERSGQTELTPTSPIPIPGREVHTEQSMPDISTADQSYVTAPATIQGTTDSSGRTPGASWEASQGRFPPTQPGPTWEPA
ncbi:hypothetical protein BDY19DRAFT_895416 [Irpex rosettiformis]|uniref:Uncharacterized protein n=1 Tax=Irpex rosettiformis TaxID=378272 RepID=A0ACB8TVP7_9APHY|nr:hypothetical protein BDY19DRAFT_895416 [Irpex rosettiformis]